MGFFEHMAAFDDSEREQERTAAAVANRRAESRFGSFVRSAVDANDRRARLDLIEDELRQVVADVVSEYGGDPGRIEASLRDKFAMDPYGPMGDASVVPPPMPPEGAVATPGPGADLQGGMGLHPCAQGHPNCAATPGGACSQRVQEPDAPGLGGFGQPMGGQAPMYSHTAAGEDGPITPLFGDRAPEIQHHPDPEQSFESIDQELADAPSAVGHGVLSGLTPGVHDPLAGEGDKLNADYRYEQGMETHGGHPCPQCGMSAEERAMNPSNNGLNCPGCGFEAYPEGVEPARMYSPHVQASDSTGLDDTPSPKMDKKKWKPNALNDEGNLKPIDTDGGRYKTEQHDVDDQPEYNHGDGDGSWRADSPVTKHEDLPTEKGDAGFQSGGEEHGDHTDTWSGKKDQADPVTNTALSSIHEAKPGHCAECGGTGSDMRSGGKCLYCDGTGDDYKGNPMDYGHNMYDQYPQDQPDPGIHPGDMPTYAASTHDATSMPPMPGATPGAAPGAGGATCPNCGGAGCPLCQGQQQQAAPAAGVPPTVASADVDKNPLREIIDSEFNQFLPASQVQRAIAAYKKGK